MDVMATKGWYGGGVGLNKNPIDFLVGAGVKNSGEVEGKLGIGLEF